MFFKVTTIQFDFTADYGTLALESQKQLLDWVYAKKWQVENEEELVDAISDATGWCVKFIDYEIE